LHAQSISYFTKTQTYVFNDTEVFTEIPLEEQGESLAKGKIFNYDFGDDYFCYISGEAYSLISNKNGKLFLLDDLERNDFNRDVHEKINGTWIAFYYYDVIYKNDISELKKNETFWENEWKFDGERWQDIIYPSYIYIYDNYFIIATNDGFKFSYLIVNENESYEFNVYLGDLFLTPDFYSKTNFINNYKTSGFYQFKIQLDGDYLTLIDKKNEKPIMKFARTNDRFKIRENLRKIANNKKISLENITWPRHADGTCDYEDVSSVKTVSSPTTNVTPNKTMTVSENLKLRSGEATTSEVITVMSAGTKVKILELGKAENIDGINSNWVKVEVQSGAKDREGNTISRGTVGWCYGGYLAETTEANNYESTDTKEISDIKIEEEPKQEINIGIVCAIIGAVLLLLLVILIFAVRKKKDNP
jgi:hypothetical protein